MPSHQEGEVRKQMGPGWGSQTPARLVRYKSAPYCSAGTLGRLQNKDWGWVELTQIRSKWLACPFLALSVGASHQGNKPYWNPSSMFQDLMRVFHGHARRPRMGGERTRVLICLNFRTQLLSHCDSSLERFLWASWEERGTWGIP